MKNISLTTVQGAKETMKNVIFVKAKGALTLNLPKNSKQKFKN